MEQAPSISDSRRSVLDALKQRGEAGADELATDLGLTVAGVRQHLGTLIDEGLVTSHEVPRPGGGRGRRPVR